MPLKEYEMAQNSAQHHDNLVWVVSTIVFAANGVLLDVVLDKEHAAFCSEACVVGYLPLLLAVFAVGMNGFLIIALEQFGAIKRQRYARCKEIEGLLHMRVHRETPSFGFRQQNMLSALSIVMLVIWILVGVYGFCHLVKCIKCC